MLYEHQAAQIVRGRVRHEGGSDPLFSPGLRPEKQQGIAPALSYFVMVFVVARVRLALFPANRKQYLTAQFFNPENYCSSQAGIFSLRGFTHFLPISISRGVFRRTIPSRFLTRSPPSRESAMPSPNEILDLSHLLPGQEITASKALDPESLLTLRPMFLLLDQWDREVQRATPVDSKTKPAQGERHAFGRNACGQRTK